MNYIYNFFKAVTPAWMSDKNKNLEPQDQIKVEERVEEVAQEVLPNESENGSVVNRDLQEVNAIDLNPISLPLDSEPPKDLKELEDIAAKLGLEGDAVKGFVTALHSKDLYVLRNFLGDNRIFAAFYRSKTDKLSVLCWSDRHQIAESASKVCRLGYRIRENKQPRIKPVAILADNKDAMIFSQSKDNSIQNYQELKELLMNQLKEVSSLFIKYKNIPDEDEFVASYADGGDFESGEVKERFFKDDAFRKETILRLLKAGDFLERNGFHHNDIKPANLLMKEGKLVVADIELMETPTFHFEELYSTAGYMPPDAEVGKKMKTDQFSVGVTLLELMTGMHIAELLIDPLEAGQGKEGAAKLPLATEKRVGLLISKLTAAENDNKLIPVIMGFLSPSHEGRMEFKEAIKSLGEDWELDEAVLKEIKAAVQSFSESV